MYSIGKDLITPGKQFPRAVKVLPSNEGIFSVAHGTTLIKDLLNKRKAQKVIWKTTGSIVEYGMLWKCPNLHHRLRISLSIQFVKRQLFVYSRHATIRRTRTASHQFIWCPQHSSFYYVRQLWKVLLSCHLLPHLRPSIHWSSISGRSSNWPQLIW